VDTVSEDFKYHVTENNQTPVSDAYIGRTFERLTIIALHTRLRDSNHKYICKCTCGKFKVVFKRNLTTGRSKSCGCIFLELNKIGRKRSP
jgi:hypothetical protein